MRNTPTRTIAIVVGIIGIVIPTIIGKNLLYPRAQAFPSHESGWTYIGRYAYYKKICLDGVSFHIITETNGGKAMYPVLEGGGPAPSVQECQEKK